MTTRFVQPGKVLDFQNTATPRASGDVVVVGARVGLCLGNIAANAVGSVQICGVFTVPKLSTDAAAQGALLYWDAANNRMTTTVGANVLAGFAFAGAAAATTSVQVLLNGLPA